MPYIKPRNLHSQHGIGYHGSFLGVAGEALAINDIVIATGYSGDRIKFSKADGNADDLDSGVMGIADHAAPVGGSVRVVTHKLLTSVDTLASAVGRPIYLSDTAGGWSLTGTSAIVGSVVADSATLGAVLVSPSNVAPAKHAMGNAAGALLADNTTAIELTSAGDGKTFACILDGAAKTVKLPASATRVGMKLKIVQVVSLVGSGVLTILANTGNTFSLNSYAVGAGVTVYRPPLTANNSCVITGAATNSAFGAGSTITAELVAPNEWMLSIECVPLGTGSDAVAFATV
jgi:hypothetical protein